jgi:hypothetical protein
VEQVEMLAEAAMVAFFSFFEHVQIGVEVFLLGPGRAVDALQLLVAVVAAPVGAGHLHQLEDLELARGRHVRAAAEVDEIAFAVERNLLVGRNRGDQFGLVLFARSRKNFTAASRDQTSRLTGISFFASSPMRFSIATRSSGVNGRL